MPFFGVQMIQEKFNMTNGLIKGWSLILKDQIITLMPNFPTNEKEFFKKNAVKSYCLGICGCKTQCLSYK